MTFYFDISIKSINIYAKLMIFNKFLNFCAHLFILMIIPNNLVNAMPIFIIYNIKIQMVYFEQLRLLILLVMAYFSYRKLSNTAFTAIEQYEDSIEEEDSINEENSQLENESAGQDVEAGDDCEEKVVIDVDGECQQVQEAVQGSVCQIPILIDDLVPLAEEIVDTSNVLAEVDENETTSKLGKRKLIKKSWKREKRQSTSQTIISSEGQVESEADDLKENEMIDI